MKITIQNQDYTAALDTVRPLTIERKLNAPSVCQLCLSLPKSGNLPLPQRNQPIAVTGDNGTVYFTGYLAGSPLPEYAGMALEGPCYRMTIQALSDEILLDQLLMPPSAGIGGQSAGTLLASLVQRSGSSALATQALSLSAGVSHFVPEPGAPWSRTAGQAAAQACAAYRALSGALTLSAVPGAVHSLSEAGGSLTLDSLSLNSSVKRALANDVTVCGEHEPAAYVTEYFQGDGATTQFDLSAEPFFLAASQSTMIDELFNESQIDTRVWGNNSGPGYLQLGAAGLTMNGGNGIDGEGLLTWLDPIEMAGTLLLEAKGVMLSPGSTGVVAGFFVGAETQDACIAGFQATAQQGAGAVTLQPLIQGTPAGMSYAIVPNCQYTLRIRVHCVETARELAIYRAFGDGGLIEYGGNWNMAPARIEMEIQSFTNGVGAMPVILYDGGIAALPTTCSVVPCSSINLIGSIRAIALTSLGSGWVVSTPPNGGPRTRRIGSTAQAAECYLERSGKLTFYSGFTPAAGEQIAVSYRTLGRAVGRAVNAASQQALTQAGSPAEAAWIGSVTAPAPRSSADCRNAALVLSQAAASTSALWSGVYKTTSVAIASDVWPGDALQLDVPSAGLNAQVVVRSVKLSYSASAPDLVEYSIAFANDWADDLAIKTSATVPADAWLPAPVAPTVLANLTGLTVTAIGGSSVTVNCGTAPPPGGGFEVRRRDFAFMPGEDPDLVLRATVPVMTFSRQSANDRFYIRMYDGATPPNYSEFSVALFLNLPFGS